MSNIGKQPIEIPKGVEVVKDDYTITVKGSLGELSQDINPLMQVEVSDSDVIVTRNSDEKKQRELHGLTRVLIANMVQGVSKGFQKELELVGVAIQPMQIKGIILF